MKASIHLDAAPAIEAQGHQKNPAAHTVAIVLQTPSVPGYGKKSK